MGKEFGLLFAGVFPSALILNGCNTGNANLNLVPVTTCKDRIQNCEQRAAPIENSPSYKSFEPHINVTPSARGCPDENGLYFVGSYIYWISQIDNYFLTARETPTTGFGINRNEALDIMKYDYNSGFKAGAGYNLPMDNWDIFFNWTWLHSSPSHTIQSSTQNLFTLLTSGRGNVRRCDGVNAHWNLRYNTLDFELGRKFYVGKFLSIRPFAGARGGRIDQRMKVVYKDVVDTNTNPPTAFPNETAILKDRMWAVGPRMGMNSRWALGRSGFGFLADGAISLVWEHFHPTFISRVFATDATGVLAPNGLIIKTEHSELEPVAELFLGLDWGKCYACKTYINFSAGYEMQYWWDQMKVITSLGSATNQELGLNGLTAKFRIDF